MRLVVLESPYSAPDAAGLAANLAYAQDCLLDCLVRGESPIASHLLFPGALDDAMPAERRLGIAAGHAWIRVADASVVYIDHGVSAGMEQGVREARRLGRPVEYRSLRHAG